MVKGIKNMGNPAERANLRWKGVKAVVMSAVAKVVVKVVSAGLSRASKENRMMLENHQSQLMLNLLLLKNLPKAQFLTWTGTEDLINLRILFSIFILVFVIVCDMKRYL